MKRKDERREGVIVYVTILVSEFLGQVLCIVRTLGLLGSTESLLLRGDSRRGLTDRLFCTSC